MKRHALPFLCLSAALATSAAGAEPAIDAERWKITLPVPDSRGQALEITNPEFVGFLADPASIPEAYARFFRFENGAWICHCPADGATTVNSDYCRTELREMRGSSGDDEFEWTLAEGGTLEFRFKIGPLAGGAKKLIFAQIHGHEPSSKPLLKCLWEKGHLRLLIKSGEKLKDHKEQQRYLELAEGRWYVCKLVASADELSVAIDGAIVERFDRRHLRFWPEENTFYFKVGNYLQETEAGGAATVSISHVSVRHGEKQEE